MRRSRVSRRVPGGKSLPTGSIVASMPSYVGAASVTVWSPALAVLTGWYRGSYGGTPWAGTASAGTSATPALLDPGGGAAATVGSAVNTFTPAAFNGTSKYLKDNVTLAPSYISTTGYRLSFLINATAAAAPAGSIFNNPGLFTENGGNWGVVFNTDGVNVYHFSGSYKVAKQACSTGAWHAVDVVYDGVNLTVSVDGVAGTPVAAGTLGSITGALMAFGANFNHTVFFNGTIMEMSTAQSAIAGSTPTMFKAYYNARYGLAL